MFRTNFSGFTNALLIGLGIFASFIIGRRVFAFSPKVKAHDSVVETQQWTQSFPVKVAKTVSASKTALAEPAASTPPQELTTSDADPVLETPSPAEGQTQDDDPSSDPQEQSLLANEGWEATRENIYAQLNIDYPQYEQIKQARRDFQNYFYEAYRQTGEIENEGLIINFDQQIQGILGAEKFEELKRMRESYVYDLNTQAQFGIDERNRW